MAEEVLLWITKQVVLLIDGIWLGIAKVLMKEYSLYVI